MDHFASQFFKSHYGKLVINQCNKETFEGLLPPWPSTCFNILPPNFSALHCGKYGRGGRNQLIFQNTQFNPIIISAAVADFTIKLNSTHCNTLVGA